MAGLASSFLDLRMDKDWRVRASDWEADDLSERQTLYAANDALISINIALQVHVLKVISISHAIPILCKIRLCTKPRQ